MVAELSSCGQMGEWAGGSCTQLIELIGSGHVVAHSLHVDRWGSRQLVAALSSCGQMVEGAGGSCTQFM